MALVRSSKTVIRKFSSALYITGDKAQSNFVVLTPQIDFDHDLIQHKSDLVKSIVARKLPIDLDRIEQRWNFFKMIHDHKTILETTKAEITNMINKLKTEDEEKNKTDIEKLLLHSKMVKNDLKNVKDYSYSIEESAALAVLGLPNLLHSQTPLDSELIINQFLEKPNAIDKSHIDIGKLNNLIEYKNPMFYFLKSDAALFEFSLTNYLQSNLLDSGFTQLSNADFARSIVVEGCGTNYLDKSKIFTLDEFHGDLSRLHLAGGASLYSFMAYFARNILQPTCLPLKLFSIGRKYCPVIDYNNHSLFNLAQQSAVHFFVATENDSVRMDETLNDLTEQLMKIYEPLGYHFKLVYVPASDLKPTESLRLSLQLFSNYLQKYVEVGNASVYDDYLSKRLLFTYGNSKEKKFVKVISGEFLNVQKFLGCALENNLPKQQELFSDLLKKYM